MCRAVGVVQVINLERDLVKLRASLEEGGGADRASVEEVRWCVAFPLLVHVACFILVLTMTEARIERSR